MRSLGYARDDRFLSGMTECFERDDSIPCHPERAKRTEGFSADWTRSLHCGRDDSVLAARGGSVIAARDGTQVCHPERSRRISSAESLKSESLPLSRDPSTTVGMTAY